MAVPNAKPALPTVQTGAFRPLQIPPCVLTPKDLRDLYKLLAQKATEAAEFQVGSVNLQPGQTQAQFNDFREQIRNALKLVVRVQTDNGQWTNSTTMEPLTDEGFPNRVVRIEFSSLFLFQAQFFNLYPNNYFTVVFDLSRPSVLDVNTLPVANTSSATVAGFNTTWTNGLYDELVTFFRQRPTSRGWLHFNLTHTALVFIVGFPLSFIVVYYLAAIIRRRAALPDALTVAVYVYIVLFVLFLFRIVFNYARWVFPPVEVNAPHQHIATAHKAAIIALGGMILAALVAAALKLMGIG